MLCKVKSQRHSLRLSVTSSSPKHSNNNERTTICDLSTPFTMTGTTCYFCLDDASSSIGPIVRECSCRGDAAGAHLACIITYATQKSKLAATLDLAAFTMPWNECINCKQYPVPKEKAREDADAENISFHVYEYKTSFRKDGKERRRLELVQKNCKIGKFHRLHYWPSDVGGTT